MYNYDGWNIMRKDKAGKLITSGKLELTGIQWRRRGKCLDSQYASDMYGKRIDPDPRIGQ